MIQWIYASVVLAMLTGFVGVAVSGFVLRQVLVSSKPPRPAIVWLLFVLLAMSFGQLIEQTRVLAFRLSFDRLIEPGIFHTIYGSAWNVASSKLLLSLAIVVGATVKLGIYWNKPDSLVTKWAGGAIVLTLGAWMLLAYVLEDLFL